MGLGITLEQVKRMPMWELATWTEYVKENGPLNLGLRIESAIARVAVRTIRNSQFRDFTPWPRQPEEVPQVGQMKSGLMAIFKKAAAKTKLSKG